MLRLPLESAVQQVPLGQIDAEDRTFLHTYPERPPQELAESVAALGVVQPLVVQQVAPERCRIVSGFRRFWAAQAAELQTVPVQRLTTASPDETELLRWTALENAGHRRLNRVELALLLSRLKEHGTSTDDLLAFSALVGGPTTEEQLDRLLALLKLEQGFLNLAAQNRLPDETVDLLLALRSEDRQEILRVANSLHLSFSRLRELVRFGSDVARRERKSLAELLRGPAFGTLLEGEKLTPSQKTERFFQLLRAKRYPRLSAAESRFEELRRQLRLPPRSRLEHSPSFETPELTLELRFTGPRQFGEAVRSLQRLRENPALDELFHFLELTPEEEPDDASS